MKPTVKPTTKPVATAKPTVRPTVKPTAKPVATAKPTVKPVAGTKPTAKPVATARPTASPTRPPGPGKPLYECNTWPPAGIMTLFAQGDHPISARSSDGVPLTLGLQFGVTWTGDISAFRYYKSASDDGMEEHTGRIYSWPDGKVLADTEPFTAEACSGAGWVTIPLNRPLRAVEGHTYVLAIDNMSSYASSGNFLRADYKKGYLVAKMGGGLYGFTPGVMPRDKYGSTSYTNYWLDGEWWSWAAGGRLGCVGIMDRVDPIGVVYLHFDISAY